jgi:hypothetical protein
MFGQRCFPSLRFAVVVAHRVEPCFMQHKGSGTGVINNANYGPTWGAGTFTAEPHITHRIASHLLASGA